MRKLCWFSAGFAAASAVCFYIFDGWQLMAAAVVLLLISAGMIFLFNPEGRRKIAAIVLLGFSIGTLWFRLYAMFSYSGVAELDGNVVFLEATVTDYGYESGYGTAVDAETTLAGDSVDCKLYLTEYLDLRPGDHIEGQFLVRFTGPGAEKEIPSHSANGTFLLCYSKGDVAVYPQMDGAEAYTAAYLRRSISAHIEEQFPEDVSGFATAVLLGSRNGIDYETETNLTVSGIIHVVSVSGLHVSIIFAILYRIFGRHRFLMPLFGGIALIFICAITGFSAPIVRSCLMNALMLAALAFDRDYDHPTGLGFAVLVMLLLNPCMIAAIGFQLSVASVFGIITTSGAISAWIEERSFWVDKKPGSFLGKLRRRVAGSVGTTLGASLFTAPFTAIHFGTVSLIGVLTNLICLGVVTFVFCGTILSVIVGYFLPIVATGMGWVIGFAIRFILFVSDLLGGIPYSAVYTQSIYTVWWLITAIVLIGVFVFSRKKPAILLICCISISLVISQVAAWLEPRLDDWRITALDVGQGQCIVFQSDGRTYMVDCGGDQPETAADVAAEFLHSQGIFRLDGLIVTHYDDDHMGGVPYLLTRISADTLYLPPADGSDEAELLRMLSDRENVVWVEEDAEISWNQCKLSLFAPRYSGDSNERSVCILFHRETCDILITGDLPEDGEHLLMLAHDLPQLDVLVAGHHGAKGSTSQRLLDKTTPRAVIISVGRDNSYDHPAPALMERLEKCQTVIYRTDIMGNVVIKE